MKIIDIIEKEESERTSSELQYCFDIFTKQDGTVSNLLELKDFPEFNKILNNLRLLSKSRLQLFNYCPFKFKCQYLLHLRIESNAEIMIAGKNLHLINQQFWDWFNAEIFHTFLENESKLNNVIVDSIYHYIKDNYMKFIPDVKLTEFEQQMVNNFTQFESNRIYYIFINVGMSIEVIKKYVKPLFNELAIENWDSKLMGIIDRADHLTNEANALLEYKYGKPKYFDTYKEQNITQELAFYNILVQGNAHCIQSKEGKDVLVPLKEYLGFEPKFYYGAMIFFQDFKETARLFKIKSIHMTAVKNQITKFWTTLESGLYYPKPTDACYTWCDFYWGLCEHNPCWKAIEKVMYE